MPTKMLCHYEVFDLPPSSTADEIKKQYKKLALKFHPDKNVGNEAEATEKFKLVQAAYTVLSDPQERKWYDDHRESILKGGDGTKGTGGGGGDDDGPLVDLWPYFSSSCCSGPEDGPTGFNTVYRELFEELAESERAQRDDEEGGGTGPLDNFPDFGDSDSVAREVFAFYTYWTNFVTKMSFSWEDEYNPNDAPNRQVRRAIEKENKKLRDVGKKKYNETVRALAAYLRKRDLRVLRFDEEAKAKRADDERRRAELKLEEQQRRRDKRESLKAALENDEEEQQRRLQERQGAFLLADNSDEDDGGNMLDSDDEVAGLGGRGGGAVQRGPCIGEDGDDSVGNADDGDGDSDDDDGGGVQRIALECCALCRKEFKTVAQLQQHLASKIHRKKAQEAAKKEQKAGNGKKPTHQQHEQQEQQHQKQQPQQQQQPKQQQKPGPTAPIAHDDDEDDGSDDDVLPLPYARTSAFSLNDDDDDDDDSDSEDADGTAVAAALASMAVQKKKQTQTQQKGKPSQAWTARGNGNITAVDSAADIDNRRKKKSSAF